MRLLLLLSVWVATVVAKPGWATFYGLPVPAHTAPAATEPVPRLRERFIWGRAARVVGGRRAARRRAATTVG